MSLLNGQKQACPLSHEHLSPIASPPQDSGRCGFGRHRARPVPPVLWKMRERRSRRLEDWPKQAPCLDPDGPPRPYSGAGDTAEGDKVVQKWKEPTVVFTLISISRSLLELSAVGAPKREIGLVSCRQTWAPPHLASVSVSSPVPWRQTLRKEGATWGHKCEKVHSCKLSRHGSNKNGAKRNWTCFPFQRYPA